MTLGFVCVPSVFKFEDTKNKIEMTFGSMNSEYSEVRGVVKG